MKRLVLAAPLVAAWGGNALATDATTTLIGKSSFDIVACAGAPASDMKFGGGRESLTCGINDSSINARGNGLSLIIGDSSDNSCQAIVQLQNDRITKILWKKEGGFISSALMCTQTGKGVAMAPNSSAHLSGAGRPPRGMSRILSLLNRTARILTSGRLAFDRGTKAQ
jgi:hypothetical protein